LLGNLNIVVASGPFTTDDNLLYDHLDKLMLYCKNNKPDVLILTGAFLSTRSPLIEDIATTIDEHFEKMLMGILETVGNETHVLVVADNDDINSSGVYPTHPYRVSRAHPNLHLLPDPCIVDINGVQIGLTSMDVCQAVTDAELAM
jgi:DNA polymerase alpha subunit B